MTLTTLQTLIEQVQTGSLSVAAAVERLRTLPFSETAEVLADTHRLIRQGFPEAVFAEGKTPAQVLTAMTALFTAQGFALATRVSAAQAEVVKAAWPDGVYDPCSRLLTLSQMERKTTAAPIGVICAGTSDLPVSEEAAQTLAFSGYSVTRLTDVGVAGLHRLLARLDLIRSCSALIVVAGMEGALPGVVGGLVACPVIAVPASVGYGASFNGLSALLTMLNTCASGVTVVNIDNGYGAAVAVQRILRQHEPLSE
jgi:pyridinium-3,5-biscarboxylic acid mononucleotide synthase